MKSDITYKNAPFLQRIEQQITQLSAQLSHFMETQQTLKTPTAKSYFHEQLFITRTDNFTDYLAEIKKNYTSFVAMVQKNHSEQSAFLAERLIRQIAALQREIATHSLRLTPPASYPSRQTPPQQTLGQYYEFHRRLKEMLHDKTQQLMQTHSFNTKRELQHAITLLEQRLQRCQSAIMQLENELDYDGNF